MPGPWLDLAALKKHKEIEEGDTRDDDNLTDALHAAMTFVERVRHGQFTFDGESTALTGLPQPNEDLKLGTLMLADRFNTRRRSPEGLVSMGEMGSARVPSFDPDIDRLLRIGRHARPVVG